MPNDDLNLLETRLHKTRQWIARSRELHQALLKYRPLERQAAAYDAERLTEWLQKSRNACREKARIVADKLKKADHPAMLEFGLLGIRSTASLHETVHTRLLAWFLSPTQPHGLGNCLLRALIMETSDGEPAPWESMNVRHVKAEHEVKKRAHRYFRRGIHRRNPLVELDRIEIERGDQRRKKSIKKI